MEPLVSTSEAEFGALGPGEPSSSSHSRPRAPWTPMEHEVFLKALAQHGRDWRRVSAVLQEAAAGRGDCGAARTLAQVRIWGGERGTGGRFGSGGRRRGMEKMRRRISAAAVFFSSVRARDFLGCSMRTSRRGRRAPLSPQFGCNDLDCIESARDKRGLAEGLLVIDRAESTFFLAKAERRKRGKNQRPTLSDSEQPGSAVSPIGQAKISFPSL